MSAVNSGYLENNVSLPPYRQARLSARVALGLDEGGWSKNAASNVEIPHTMNEEWAAGLLYEFVKNKNAVLG